MKIQKAILKGKEYKVGDIIKFNDRNNNNRDGIILSIEDFNVPMFEILWYSESCIWSDNYSENDIYDITKHDDSLTIKDFVAALKKGIIDYNERHERKDKEHKDILKRLETLVSII